MEHGVHESAGPGGTLHWRERSDRHWIARGLGGAFDAAPLRSGGYQLYWVPDGGHFVDLGAHGTLGGAWATARDYADGTFVPRHAAEAGPAAEEGCAHTHPPDVATSPCADPAPGPVVVEKTEVAASQTVLVAGEDAGGLPGLAKWNRFAGGTSANPKQSSYGYITPTHQYSIAAIGGRRPGYILTVFPSPTSGHGWITPDGKSHGFVHPGSFYRSPADAVRAARKFERFEAHAPRMAKEAAKKRPKARRGARRTK